MRVAPGWRSTVNKVLLGLDVAAHDAAVPIVETFAARTPGTLILSASDKVKQDNLAQRVEAETDTSAGDTIRNNGSPARFGCPKPHPICAQMDPRGQNSSANAARFETLKMLAHLRTLT